MTAAIFLMNFWNLLRKVRFKSNINSQVLVDEAYRSKYDECSIFKM